jgi:hypothetical protein
VVVVPGSSFVAAGRVTARLYVVVALSSVAVSASDVTRTVRCPTTVVPRESVPREVSSSW